MGELPVIFLMGPTASGKTALAVRLVRRLPLEIVSVDSALIYRGLDIGTAKPGAEVLRIAPHRLIDIRDPAEVYSAGMFRCDAEREIEAIHRSGRVPLLVGGTGLYFRALEQGLSELPPANAAIRAAIDREAQERGWAAMHRLLAEVDPESAARIHPNDPQRIQRALEVYRASGRPLTQAFREGRRAAPRWKVVKLVLAPADRSAVHERVRARFAGMLRRGFMEEMRALYRRGDLRPEIPSMRLVGYRQGWRHLAGEISYEEMVEQTVAATRRLVRRQLTWLRREPETRLFEAPDGKLEDKVLKFMEQRRIFPV